MAATELAVTRSASSQLKATVPEWSKPAVAGRPVGRPLPGSAELPRAAGCALRRHRSRAEALPRVHFDHATVPSTGVCCPSSLSVPSSVDRHCSRGGAALARPESVAPAFAPPEVPLKCHSRAVPSLLPLAW
eukprot:scaffold64469_cov44-Phaeocystis_antarctica.AAC.4